MIRAEIQQLRSEITRPAPTPLPTPVQAPITIDLFAQDDTAPASGKRPLSSNTASDTNERQARKKEKRDMELARRQSLMTELLRQERMRQKGQGASSSSAAQ